MSGPPPDPPHVRLERAMEERRLELDPPLNWTQVARSAHISPQALRAIRRGEYRPSRITARDLDRALHWALGSVEAVYEGGGPTPVGSPEADSGAAPAAESDPADDLAQRPDEGPWEYLDRIIGAWQCERDFGRPEDQMRARVIRSVLDQEQDQDRDRDAG